jgi:hypothetical protein
MTGWDISNGWGIEEEEKKGTKITNQLFTQICVYFK